jgi:hypothetical protein
MLYHPNLDNLSKLSLHLTSTSSTNHKNIHSTQGSAQNLFDPLSDRIIRELTISTRARRDKTTSVTKTKTAMIPMKRPHPLSRLSDSSQHHARGTLVPVHPPPSLDLSPQRLEVGRVSSWQLLTLFPTVSFIIVVLGPFIIY